VGYRSPILYLTTGRPMSETLKDLGVAQLDALIAEVSKLRDATRERRCKELGAKIEGTSKREGFTVAEVLAAKPTP
jgi:hypothetical protein